MWEQSFCSPKWPGYTLVENLQKTCEMQWRVALREWHCGSGTAGVALREWHCGSGTAGVALGGGGADPDNAVRYINWQSWVSLYSFIGTGRGSGSSPVRRRYIPWSLLPLRRHEYRAGGHTHIYGRSVRCLFLYDYQLALSLVRLTGRQWIDDGRAVRRDGETIGDEEALYTGQAASRWYVYSYLSLCTN